MKYLLLLGFFVLRLPSYAQENNPLDIFENLIGSTWISEGKQLGGHEGRTVKEFDWGLNGKIVKVKTYTTDPKTMEFGLRNEGVRIYNTSTNRIEFYEFDKLGGVTHGIVKVDGQDIFYEYTYGDLILRDSWSYISNDEYQYSVCALASDSCRKIYHRGIFKRSK